MDRIKKALAKLSPKERALVKDIVIQLKTGSFSNLDIKKLKGYKHIYRVRSGKIRIIYQTIETEIFILTIDRRSDTTYKKF
jgi:mRNA-degrading endonuclease RelE of RelBE toxin-antitoxin system